MNGQIKQSSKTSNLTFGVSKLISFIFEVMTLSPWDVISTRTQEGIGLMLRGDTDEVVIEKISRFKKPCNKIEYQHTAFTTTIIPFLSIQFCATRAFQ
jgi:2-keto-4-pentenoate hydratase/2-oxohepta-3-ene-1,7-dioic acid hydratase in catechol pathway